MLNNLKERGLIELRRRHIVCAFAETLNSKCTVDKKNFEALNRVLDVLEELREKCPWDKKQTNESLRPNTIEEVYELCDALMQSDDKEICKELGDVLLPCVLLCQDR